MAAGCESGRWVAGGGGWEMGGQVSATEGVWSADQGRRDEQRPAQGCQSQQDPPAASCRQAGAWPPPARPGLTRCGPRYAAGLLLRPLNKERPQLGKQAGRKQRLRLQRRQGVGEC